MDLSYLTLALVFETLCAANSSVGQIPKNHFGVLQLLREVGKRIGNAGPEKSRALVTHTTTGLSLSPEGWRLSRESFYSTALIFSDWIPSLPNDPQGRPVQVWVPRHAPGVTVADDWASFGQRTTSSGSVIFDNVLIESEAQIFPLWQRKEVPSPAWQLIQAAVDSGIAVSALDEATQFLREKSPPWVDAGVSRAQDDPFIISDIGRLQIDLWAAQEVLREAALTLDEIAAAPVTAQSSTPASVAVAEARILTTEIALQATEKLFELAGSASTLAILNPGRHWRNARVHALHDPVRWKYHTVGNHRLNGMNPPRHSAI